MQRRARYKKKPTVAQRLDGMQAQLNDIRDLLAPKDCEPGPQCEPICSDAYDEEAESLGALIIAGVGVGIILAVTRGVIGALRGNNGEVV